MNKKTILALLLSTCLLAVLQCNFDSVDVNRPTPYSVFKGETGSTTQNTVGKGTKTFIVPIYLNIPTNRTIIVADSTTDTLWMKGQFVSYTKETGTLVLNIKETSGSGSSSKWKVIVGKTQKEVIDSLCQAYVAMKFGMFLHFNMTTYARQDFYSVSGEWEQGKEDENLFQPDSLNCGQWADIAKSAGCKYIVLTTKHHGGFLLWPSKTTKHCVSSSSWKDGKGDVIREFVDSTRSRKLEVGFYFSIWDRTDGWTVKLVKDQLTELLTNYGPIRCIWFDGWAWRSDVGYYKVPYDTIANLIHTLQPGCIAVENNHYYVPKFTDLVEYEVPVDGVPKSGNPYWAEGNEPIRTDDLWFWHPNKECDIKTADFLVSRIKACNERKASYLLDLTPNTHGLIPQCQADRMKEIGALMPAGGW